ncbi:MAG: Ig-like domain-containing protein [Planctomycetaceae bacterium]
MDSTSMNNTVSGNYIGTDVTGLGAVGNTGGGVSFWGAGTGNIASNNVISGNLYVGVLVANASAGATIQGNLIGLGANSSTVVGNADAGIYVEDASTGTLIGTDLDGNGDAAEGNTISGNSHGIIVSDVGTTGTEIQGNRIGTNAAGTLDRGNANDGVLVQNGASNTSIGGSAAGAGNLISGNNEGIELTGSATTLNTIEGNLIGLDINGTGTIGNDFDGIHVSMGAHHNTIGGTGAGAGNVVAGNGASGIQIEGSGSDFNTIQGNFIGTDITGLIGLGNGNSGVKLGNSAANNLVGGTDSGAGNVIADNSQNGIEINSSSLNTVQGNLIGIGADGVTALGNSLHGIDINSGSSSNLIGGDDSDAGNTISNNGQDGVSVDFTSGSQNAILGNSIAGNGTRGIDLADNGVSLNDAGDGDTGANGIQNFPVLTAVYSAGGNTRFRGTLNSTATTTFRIEFFENQFANSKGYGEGERFLGAINVTTDGSGNATFDQLLVGVTVTSGYSISATATVDLGGTYGNTSEFGLSIAAMGSPLLISAPLQGGETRVNTTTTDDQDVFHNFGVASAVAMDEDGNTIVVWTSNLQDGAGTGVYGQRYDRDGVAVGSEFQINTTTSNNQTNAVVAVDATGAFIVVWESSSQDGSGSGIYTRRYDSDGNAVTGEVRANVTTAGSQRAPSVAMSEDGKYVVTWQSSDGSSDGVWARVYDSSGTAVTGEFRVNSVTSLAQQKATTAMDADGDFVVVWADSSFGQIMGQRYNSSGVAQGSNFQISPDGSVSVSWPTVAMSDTGEFVVAWKSDEQSGANTQMFFRRFDATANALGGQVLIGTDDASFDDDTYPVVAMDDVGNFVIAWDESDRDGSSQGVYARRYDSTGAMIGSEFRVNTTTSGSQYFPNVAMDDEGDFTVIFVGDQSGDKDIYMQRYLGAATTSESGDTVSFHLVLDVAPSASVSISATVSDASESNSYTSGITFTSGNWNTMQTATITGANDALFDGDISYDYILDAMSSSDVLYSGVTPDSVTITNIDDEPPLLYVDTISDSTTGSDTSSIAALIANKGADGKISLREAILAANNTAGTDYIYFNITDPLVGGAHTITPASALPTITDTVILDATTDDDFPGTPIIILDGNNLAATGLTLSSTAGGSTIQGLVIRDFGVNGIEIQAGSDGNTIVGNYIGSLDINGEDAGAAEANAGVGIKILGANNIIGDIFAGLGNVIAGNTGDEIVITGTAADGNMVQSNLIGTNADGTAQITSGGIGIFVENGATNNIIGGTATDAGNVIGGNNWAGIEIKGIGTSGNLIQGNWIGTDWTGTLDFGNNEEGVRTFDGATNNTIGGIDAGAGNVIAFNAKGVSIYSADDSGNSILGNLIYSNSGIGIDLGNDGVTVNDSDDSDTGANGLQNFPVLTSASIVGSDTIITGTLNSTPGTTFLIEFYTSVAGDGSGHGEAETYLDAVTVTTDVSGNAAISLTLSGWILTDGEIVTATATQDLGGGDFGSTSEFSANVIVAGNDDPVLIDGDTVSLSEGGTATPFFGIGTVTDLDSSDFDGGGLLATITSGIQSGDVLTLASVGGVTVSGTDVLVGGFTVGTVFGGAAGVPLTITFNSDATLARVQAVYQAVALHSSVDNPVLGLRTISVTVEDGDGGTSNTATGIVDFDTAVNDVPVVTPSAPLVVAEDASGIMSLLVTDPDANGNSLEVSLSLSNSSGTITLGSTTGLTFSVGDGSLDTTMSFTGTLSDLNNALASITYTPTTGFNGAETFLYTINDQGNTGSGGAQEATGGIAITVDSENDAPVLAGGNNLTAIDEDNVFNNGTLVSDLITGLVTDPDPGTSYGIAVTAVDNSNGTWQYTIDNGSNWLSVGSVSAFAARLLTADALTRVRFVPNSNYNGTISNGITFAAWDGTSGIAGSTADIAPSIYLDQFNTSSYSNNNGTANWTGSWVETDNNGGGASNGLIRINSGVLEVKSDAAMTTFTVRWT